MMDSLAATPREGHTSTDAVALIRRPMVFCSWCSCFVSGGVLPASHTICPSCEAKHFSEEASQ